ncbi:MAG: zinc metalloprotease HtpX [Leptolyngbyaceae cyanobacterium]
MNHFKTLALLALLSGLLVGIGYLVIGGPTGILVGVGMAAVSNLGSWYFSDKIALRAYKAQPVTPAAAPQLYASVEKLSQEAEMPMPQVYVMPTQAANAFATGRDPSHAAVAVTEGIMALLTQAELEGVLAHELSHILNRDTLTQAVAATIGGAISSLAYFAQWASYSNRDGQGRRGSNPIGLLLAVFVAPLAATLIQMSISRTREFAADAGAGQLTKNPLALASALRKLEGRTQTAPMPGNPAFEPLLIVNAFAKQGLSNLFATHPDTAARIEALESQAQELAQLASTSSV